MTHRKSGVVGYIGAVQTGDERTPFEPIERTIDYEVTVFGSSLEDAREHTFPDADFAAAAIGTLPETFNGWRKMNTITTKHAPVTMRRRTSKDGRTLIYTCPTCQRRIMKDGPGAAIDEKGRTVVLRYPIYCEGDAIAGAEGICTWNLRSE